MLQAAADRQLDALCRRRQRVGKDQARQGPGTGLRHGGIGQVRPCDEGGGVDVRGEGGAGGRSGALLLLIGRRAQHEFVADRSGVDQAAHTNLARPGTVVAVLHDRGLRGVAVHVDDRGEPAVEILRPAVVGAERGVGREVFRDVDFRPDRPEQFLAPVEPPGLAEIVAELGHAGNGHAQRHRRHCHQPSDILVLVAEIGRQTHPLAAEIQAEQGETQLVGVPVDGRLARPIHAVETHTELLLLAEPPADIDMATELGIGSIVGRRLGQRLIGRPLGDQVDRSSDRPARCHAGQHGARPLQDFDPLRQFGGHGYPRQNSVQPTEGIVAAAHPESSDRQVVATSGAAGPDAADRRIVDQHVLDALRLLVLGLLRRVVRLVERRVHHVTIAQDTELATRRHLATGVRRRQVVDHRLLRHHETLDLDGIELKGAGGRRRRQMLDDDHRSAQPIDQAGPGKQRAQGLVGGHAAARTLRPAIADHGGLGRDLQARLSGEFDQPSGQGLRLDVEVANAGLCDCRFGRLCRGDTGHCEAADGDSQQKTRADIRSAPRGGALFYRPHFRFPTPYDLRGLPTRSQSHPCAPQRVLTDGPMVFPTSHRLADLCRGTCSGYRAVTSSIQGEIWRTTASWAEARLRNVVSGSRRS